MAFLKNPNCLAEYHEALLVGGESFRESKRRQKHVRTRSELPNSAIDSLGRAVVSHTKLETVGNESEHLAEELSSSEPILCSNEVNYCLVKSTEKNAVDNSLPSVGSQRHLGHSVRSRNDDFTKGSLINVMYPAFRDDKTSDLAKRTSVSPNSQAKRKVDRLAKFNSNTLECKEGTRRETEEPDLRGKTRGDSGSRGRVVREEQGKGSQKESLSSGEQNDKAGSAKDHIRPSCMCSLSWTGRVRQDSTPDNRQSGVRTVLKRPTSVLDEHIWSTLFSKKETATQESNQNNSKKAQKMHQKSSRMEGDSLADSPGALLKGPGSELRGTRIEAQFPLIPDRPSESPAMSPLDFLELNHEMNSKRITHVWQKRISESSFSVHNETEPTKRSLIMSTSVRAHLDSVRAFEWGSFSKELHLLTLSNDCLVKQWRVKSEADFGLSCLDKTGSLMSKLTIEANSLASDHHQPLDFTGSQPTSTTVFREPQSCHSKRTDRDMVPNDSLKASRVRLKHASTFRLHTAPIFSSFAHQQSDGTIRLFSGDSKGWVHCSVLGEEGLRSTTAFSTGCEPCWAISLLQKDTLVVSTPDRVIVQRLSDNKLNKERLDFVNKNENFGQLKRQTDASFLINSFTPKGLTCHFASFDVQRQKEAFRVSSSQGFSNSFVFVPQLCNLYSANHNKTVSIHDLRMPSTADCFFAHSDSVTCIDVSFDQQLVVTAGSDLSVRLWDLRNFKILTDLKAHLPKDDDSIFEIKFDPSSKLIASCGADGALKIFHL